MEKLSMGEYTAVVWVAYGVAFVVLGVCTWLSVRGLRKAKRSLQAVAPERDQTPQQVRG